MNVRLLYCTEYWGDPHPKFVSDEEDTLYVTWAKDADEYAYPPDHPSTIRRPYCGVLVPELASTTTAKERLG